MKKRRIVKVEVKFLSLVPKGANQLKALYKDDGSFEIDTLVKVNDEGELIAVAYAPEFRDSQGDIASQDVCKQMAHSFAKNGAKLDLRHDGVAITKDRAFVAETFLVQKGDPRFAGLTDRQGNLVDPSGGWGVVVKLVDPELRAKYKSGEWDGVSLGGVAQVVVTDKEESWNMDPKELLEALKANNEEIAKTVTTGVVGVLKEVLEPLAKADKKEDDKQEDEALFKGDPTNPADVKKHLDNLRRIRLLKETNWADPESVAKLQASLEKAEPAAEKSEREIELEKELADLRKAAGRSNQPPEGASGQPTFAMVGMTKEEADGFAQGLAFAAQIRKEHEAGLSF